MSFPQRFKIDLVWATQRRVLIERALFNTPDGEGCWGGVLGRGAVVLFELRRSDVTAQLVSNSWQ